MGFSRLSLYLFCQKVLLPLQKLLLLQMLLLLLPLFLLVQKQLMLLHYSCLLLATEIGGATVSAGHGDGRWLSPHAGSLGWNRDTGRVLVLSTETRGSQVRWDTVRTISPDQSGRALLSESLAPGSLPKPLLFWHVTPEQKPQHLSVQARRRAVSG